MSHPGAPHAPDLSLPSRKIPRNPISISRCPRESHSQRPGSKPAAVVSSLSASNPAGWPQDPGPDEAKRRRQKREMRGRISLKMGDAAANLPVVPAYSVEEKRRRAAQNPTLPVSLFIYSHRFPLECLPAHQFCSLRLQAQDPAGRSVREQRAEGARRATLAMDMAMAMASASGSQTREGNWLSCGERTLVLPPNMKQLAY